MKLSLTQKKILKLLAVNCRFSNKDIAKAVGVSPDTVNYQINNLIHKNKISTFFVQFDYRATGFNHSHYLVRVKDMQKINMELLKKLECVTFINTSQGKYDLQLIVTFRDALDHEKNIQKINAILKDNIQDFSLIYFVAQLKYTQIIPSINVDVAIPKNRKSVVYSLNKENFAVGDTYEKINLDAVDYQIIQELIKNPRISFLELGRKLGKSHETIKYRIANYIRKGFVNNFGCFQDYKKHGYFATYLFLKLKHYDRESLREWLIKNPRVFYAAILLGEYNCIIYMVAETSDEFSHETKQLRKFLGDSLLDIELLYFEHVEKNVQFPEMLLEQQTKIGS